MLSDPLELSRPDHLLLRGTVHAVHVMLQVRVRCTCLGLDLQGAWPGSRESLESPESRESPDEQIVIRLCRSRRSTM